MRPPRGFSVNGMGFGGSALALILVAREAPRWRVRPTRGTDPRGSHAIRPGRARPAPRRARCTRAVGARASQAPVSPPACHASDDKDGGSSAAPMSPTSTRRARTAASSPEQPRERELVTASRLNGGRWRLDLQPPVTAAEKPHRARDMVADQQGLVGAEDGVVVREVCGGSDAPFREGTLRLDRLSTPVTLMR